MLLSWPKQKNWSWLLAMLRLLLEKHRTHATVVAKCRVEGRGNPMSLQDLSSD